MLRLSIKLEVEILIMKLLMMKACVAKNTSLAQNYSNVNGGKGKEGSKKVFGCLPITNGY